MVEAFQQSIGTYLNYSGNSLFMTFFVVCLIYLGYSEKKIGRRMILFYGSILLLAVFFFPFFSYLLINVLFDSEVYYRILWLLPMSIVVAYTGVKILILIENKAKKIVIAIGMCLLLATGGDYVFDHPSFLKAENFYHIPQSVIDVCDVVEPEEGEDWIMAVFPAEMISYVRQYSTRIHMPYGRAVLIDRWNLGHPLYETMEMEQVDVALLAEQAIEYKCDYVILPELKQISGNLEEYHFIIIDQVDGYLIYQYIGEQLEG